MPALAPFIPLFFKILSPHTIPPGADIVISCAGHIFSVKTMKLTFAFNRFCLVLLFNRSSKYPLILISMDGFRPDYLDRNLTPNINCLGKFLPELLLGIDNLHHTPSVGDFRGYPCMIILISHGPVRQYTSESPLTFLSERLLH